MMILTSEQNIYILNCSLCKGLGLLGCSERDACSSSLICGRQLSESECIPDDGSDYRLSAVAVEDVSLNISLYRNANCGYPSLEIFLSFFSLYIYI